jgi:uncharacterized protein with gpF-like domain
MSSRQFLWALSAAGLLVLAGCNKAASPDTVQNDVAKATNSAEEKDAKAAQAQAETEASASKDIQSAEEKANSQTASAAADTGLTEAEGRNKIALANCEALSGDLQQACKDKANAELDMAKANAKRMKADHS